MQIVYHNPLTVATGFFVATVAADRCGAPHRSREENAGITGVKWEVLRMLNYAVWTTVAAGALLAAGLGTDRDDESLYTSMVFLTSSTTLSYLYEIACHTPDLGHRVHHWIAMLLKLLWAWQYTSNLDDPGFIWMITVVGHLNLAALVSSVFSSYRYIALSCFSRRHYERATTVYKAVYGSDKVTGALGCYAVVCATPVRSHLARGVCMSVLFLLNGIQLYFVRKMYRYAKGSGLC